MSPALQELVIEYALSALEKQMRFDAWLGRHGWSWERESGLLTLRRAGEDEFICATQALGSLSRMSETWTWIWANDLAAISDDLMLAAQALRALGEEKKVPELAVGEFPRAQVDAHLLSLVAMEISGADAYFRGAYLGGEGFVLINRGALDSVLPPLPASAAQVCKIVREVDALCENHRRAVISYLRCRSWQIEDENEKTTARNGNENVEIIFDGARLISAKEIQE